MKSTRILTLILAIAMLFSLASCAEEKPETINVYTLNGSTGFGMAKLMNDYTGKTDYTFTVKSEPADVTAALTSGDADIAALPTNAAANLYNVSNGDIQILAINTLGSFYLLNSTGTQIKSFSELEGKTVHTPAQNPSFIFQYLCQKNNVNVTIDATSYVKPDKLRDAIASGSVEYAVLPEPMVTIAIGAAKTAGITLTKDLDLTAEWDKVTTPGSLVAGCIVARKDFVEQYPETVKAFLAEYEASIAYSATNPKETAQMIAAQGIFTNATVAEKALPKCNVCYLDGAEMKSMMQNYLTVLQGINAKSIGGKLPDDGFYYIAEEK